MEDVVTKELIDYYKKVTEYLKQLDGKKAEVEKNLDTDDAFKEVSEEENLEESANDEEESAEESSEEKGAEDA